MPIDLSKLPAPTVIEEISFENIVTATKADLVSRLPAIEPTLQLESAVVNKAIQAFSYRETLGRARVNDAARANLLAFAGEGDLDHLAAFYDVARMAGEDDARLSDSVILAIQGRSTGGTEPRYKFVAMSADIRVQDAVVYTVGRSPLIHVAVYSTEPDGVAPADLVAKVDAALQRADVRMVNDTISVASAVRQVVNLTADLWLLPDADGDTLTRAVDALRTAWASARALGRDLTVSWWTAQLMISGVHRVSPTSPVSDITVPPASALSLGTITLTNRGRAF
jgi:phage-related baseplate assembly protein